MELSLAAWSVNRRFKREAQPMRLLSLPAVTRWEFGIDQLELVSTFFANTESWYVDELRAVADGEGVRLLNIAIDACGNLSAGDDGERREAVERHSRWLAVAERLGCDAVRANTGGAPDDPADLARCIDSFAALAARGRDHGVKLMVENHGGLSTDPERMVALVEQVGENLGTLPDFGNFAEETRYQALARIAPYAHAVHAKTWRHVEPERGLTWDERDGVRRENDIARCVRVVLEAGYTGPLGIEYGGGEADHEGVLLTKQLLERL